MENSAQVVSESDVLEGLKGYSREESILGHGFTHLVLVSTIIGNAPRMNTARPCNGDYAPH